MKPTLIILLSLFSIPVFCQNSSTPFSIYFDYGKHDIRDGEHKTLNDLIDTIKLLKDYSLKLTGNTDADGTNSFNQTLSENRIQAVKDFLIKKGISESNIKATAWGEMKPISDNQTENGKQQNRRVDIYIEKLTPSVVEKKFPFEKDKKYAISRLYKELDPQMQNFEIETGKESTIVGTKGTLIHISANAFDVPDKSAVKIKLKEAYTYGDIISQNLTTNSNKDILQTDGMVYLEATYNGSSIKPKEDLFLMMPRKLSNSNQENDMQFFKGERNIKTNAINWTVPEKPNFSFFFQSYDPSGQLSSLKTLMAKVVDTCNCNKMFVWKLDSFYVRKAIREKKEGIYKEEFVISASKPNGYEFDKVHTEGLSAECLKIAAWAAPDNSWYRKIPWKLKHQIFYSDLYRDHRASNYDAFVNILKREIRICEQAIKVMKENRGKHGYSVFETKELNWINCDRFSNYAEKDLVSLETNVGVAPNIDAKIIFPRIKSVLGSSNNKGIISFNRIPKGENALIVAMKIENGESSYAIQPFKIEGNKVELKFEAMTPEEIAQKIKEL